MPNPNGTRGKAIERPAINPFFAYGQILSWSFHPTITPVKDTYAFRYTLYFESGQKKDFQKGGFRTKALAQKAKEDCPNLFLPLLLTITSGLRISEALGVKFSDIDYEKCELHVTEQVGRTMER